ncbi:MAG: sugar phosphate isomerase/epimerase [Candidatus Bathyarchaeota archaeon]|nr:MAG: sugar phosphate isomerase/epimerase [Candidatus Bathyarchaeota archaeon]
MKLGIGLAGWFQIPLETALNTISKLGYDGVEIYVWRGYIFDSSVYDPESGPSRRLGPNSRRRLRRLLDENELEIAAIGTVDFPFDYLNPSETTRKDHIQFVKECIDFGADLEASIVWSMSGPQLPKSSLDESWQKLEHTMRTCTDYASANGMTFAIEPCHGQLVSSAEDCLRLIRRVKDVKVNFDPSHFTIRGWNVPKAVKELADHIVFAHIKGTKGRVPNHQWYIPGEDPEDVASIKELTLALDEIGYTGYISVEVAHRRRTDILYDPCFAAELAYNTVSPVFEELKLRS